MVWIGVIIVIAFITVCEIALFIARRSPFVARPTVSDIWSGLTGRRVTRTATRTVLCRATRTNVSRSSGVGYATGDGRCSFPATPVTPGRRTLQLSGNARCFRLW
jgi:hypothetical protein